MESQIIPQNEKTDFGANRSIFLLGIFNFLTDLSSEMIFSAFSIFLTVILGVSFRVVQRLGKSFRAAPRDAWISSIQDL